MARLFFALWPDEAVRAKLVLWSRAAHELAGGRMTQPRNLHMTLAFLGNTDTALLPSVQAVAASVKVEPCLLTLDRCRWWKHNRIVWAGGEAPPALQEGVAQLRAGLEAAGFAFDHKAFVPHVTLLRKAVAADLPRFEPLAWPVSRFLLVAADHDAQGVRYRIVG